MKAFVRAIVRRFMVRQAHHEAVCISECWYKPPLLSGGSRYGTFSATHI
jgi:hypothetical protein